jgi:hypothetical protein
MPVLLHIFCGQNCAQAHERHLKLLILKNKEYVPLFWAGVERRRLAMCSPDFSHNLWKKM